MANVLSSETECWYIIFGKWLHDRLVRVFTLSVYLDATDEFFRARVLSAFSTEHASALILYIMATGDSPVLYS